MTDGFTISWNNEGIPISLTEEIDANQQSSRFLLKEKFQINNLEIGKLRYALKTLESCERCLIWRFTGKALFIITFFLYLQSYTSVTLSFNTKTDPTKSSYFFFNSR